MSQIIYSNGKVFEVIKKDEGPKHTHTLEEAMEEASKYSFVMRNGNNLCKWTVELLGSFFGF